VHGGRRERTLLSATDSLDADEPALNRDGICRVQRISPTVISVGVRFMRSRVLTTTRLKSGRWGSKNVTT